MRCRCDKKAKAQVKGAVERRAKAWLRAMQQYIRTGFTK